MTYAVSSALQSAVFAALTGDVALTSLVGGNIFDAPPSGVLPPTYVSLGIEDARGHSNVSVQSAVHDFAVNIYSSLAGFLSAKDVAAAVCDVLIDADLTLARGRLISLDYLRARARRGTAPDARRIELLFRARVEDI